MLLARANREFKQKRAAATYEALLAAAERVFAKSGFDDAQTPDIAAAAGVSTGAFYRYFTDKHEIYLEIARRTMVAGYHKTIANLGPERFAGRARHETISETIAILFDHVLSQPELTRSFREMSLRDPQVAEVLRAFEQVAVTRIATLITALVGRDVVPDPDATAWVLHGAVVEAAYGLAGHRGPPPISAERARQALTDFIERAIFPRS